MNIIWVEKITWIRIRILVFGLNYSNNIRIPNYSLTSALNSVRSSSLLPCQPQICQWPGIPVRAPLSLPSDSSQIAAHKGRLNPILSQNAKSSLSISLLCPLCVFFQLCTLTASEADMKKNFSVHWKYYIASQCAQQYHSFLLPRNFLKGTISIFKETHTCSIFCTKVSITWVLLGSPQQATIIRRNTS